MTCIKEQKYFLILCAIAIIAATSCKKTLAPKQTPTQEKLSFELADTNLEIQLVASEPLVQDPIAIAFDEAGRLWVVEMLSFMQDLAGNGEDDRIGRVSVLFDDDHDGVMDRGQIFLDSLHLPRAIALVEGGILVAEQRPLWFVPDANQDFVGDTKILIDSNYGGSDMPEHAGNGLWRGLDGWYYNAKSRSRYKKIRGKWTKEETEFRGQWGVSHDDAGRLFYNYNWSQLHADLVPPNYVNRNSFHHSTSGIDHGLTLNRKIYPARRNPAVNRGYVPGTLDRDGKLLEFASACAPFIYRGDLLPIDFRGDAFICEPTGNLVKRQKISENGFLLSSNEAYVKKEFLTSTDERFRPIFLADAPDGALYLVDMYRGVIQHGPYMSDYLRKITKERSLDEHIHLGRIWRIIPKNYALPKSFDLEGQETRDLISALASSNGWIRDKAQQLLVEKGDRSTIELVAKEYPNGNTFFRLHALWLLHALGGLHLLEPEMILGDQNVLVAQTGVRLLMNTDKAPTNKIIDEVLAIFPKAGERVQLQIVLESDKMTPEQALKICTEFLEQHLESPVARDAILSSLQGREWMMLNRLLAENKWLSRSQGREIFLEALGTVLTNRGNASEALRLLNLIVTLPVWQATSLLNGVNNHQRNDDEAILLESKPVLFMERNIDQYLGNELDRIRDIFEWPGKVQEKKQEDTSDLDIDRNTLALGRQKYLNLCASCHGTSGQGLKRFAPPLKNSEWVIGDADKLAMLLLHGMEGPIEVAGKRYDMPDILPVMPAFSTLQNNDIGEISTYIRNAWGHQAGPLTGQRVGHIRYRTQGKITPWSAMELDTFVFDMDL